jgi:hypothetical protein
VLGCGARRKPAFPEILALFIAPDFAIVDGANAQTVNKYFWWVAENRVK